MKLNYRPDLDGLRAIAVIFVLIFHFFPNHLENGYLGVDIFFVLSGFLIGQIVFTQLEIKTFSYVNFMRRRILRIFPALIILFISCLICGWFMLLPNEFADFGKDMSFGSLFISNWGHAQESGYFDQISHNKILLHLWSLGVEMQFYILWPAILMLFKKYARLSIVINFLILLLSAYLYFFYSSEEHNFRFYSTPHRIWEILLGTLLAQFYLNLKITKWFSTLIQIFGLSFISLGVFGDFLILNENEFKTVFVVLGAGCLIYPTDNFTLVTKILSSYLLRYIGLISYPLYLWHWSILAIYQVYFGKAQSLEIKFSLIALSIFLSILTFYFIEKPLHKDRTSIIKKTNLLLTITLVLGLVGFGIYTQEGFSARFSSFVKKISNYKFQEPAEYRKFTCFLEYNQDYSNFKKCTPNKTTSGKTLFLWGDSHAAHLYPGLLETLGSAYKIIQRTSAKCPPLLNERYERYPHCYEINQKVLNEIKATKPDKVILAALWTYYKIESLQVTVDELKKLPNTEIDLIGPVPLWEETLPKQLMQAARLYPNQEVKMRTFLGINRYFMEVDEKLTHFSKENGINYLSPKLIFCNNEGCLTMLNDTPSGLTAWDYGHLTVDSSHFLIESLYHMQISQ